MICPSRFLAALLLVSPACLHAQTTEFGGISVIQNNAGNENTSVTLSKKSGSSPSFTLEGGNRGDYNVNFGPGNDMDIGILIPHVSELSRDNSAQGDTIGRFFATAAFGPNEGAGDYTIALFSAPGSGEVNMDVNFGFFPYSRWLGGVVRSATSNGEMTELVGSSGLTLNTHFTDLATPAGQYTLNINALTGNNAAQNGVLLVTGARNEANYALSQAQANGSFTLYCHDNAANGADYENDAVGFVYLPKDRVGSDRLTAIGRVNGDASLDISANAPGKTITVTKGATGIWYLAILGESASTGTLLVSPAGGVGNTTDNIVCSGWDAANNRWVIESRDLPGAVPGLQNASDPADDVFSFAFFTAPVLPVVTLSSPTAGTTVTGPASFNLEATATDPDGSVTQVELLRNGLVIAAFTAGPYTFQDTGLKAGHYDYQARATDNEGNVATTEVAQVMVTLDPASLPVNAALSFDGSNDHVTMGAAPALNVGQMADAGFTLECWFRREGPGIPSGSGSGGVTAVPLFGKGRGESDGSPVDCNIFFGINEAGRLVADFEAQPATGVSAGENFPITATHDPVTGHAWHHAAATYDHSSSTWKLYLDGAEVGTATVKAEARPRFDSIQHFGIGTAMNSTGVTEGAFRGRIDEARVWNHARSAAQILAGKDQPLSQAEGLIARFGLNEGNGTATASSTGSHTGTLVHGPLWVEGVPFGLANVLPAVTLTQPASVSSTAVSVPVTFAATASDTDGTVVKVEFLVDGAKVGEDSVAPFSFDWTPSAVGQYGVRARVYDDLGGLALSDEATLHVLPTASHPAVSLTSPADAATVPGASTELVANVFDSNGDAMTVTFYGRHTTPVTPGPDFNIIQIPDTQFYSEGASGHADTISVQQLIATFGEQTKWVVNNRTARNIAFVSHMGDIVQKGNNNGNDIEWTRASAAMARLENPVTTLQAHGVPYGLAPGNHDMDPIGNYDGGSTSFYNQYFGLSRFAKRTYWGGNFGSDNTNNYQLFSASGLDFIAIHFAYDTTANTAILNWADALLKAHPHRRAIATCHSIIGRGNPATFSAQGRDIYEALKDNPNFFLMLCGHIHAEGRRADVFQGRTVYSILSDYQGTTNGGNGFLRMLTFSPANNSIRLESYSPTLDRAVNASDEIPSWEANVQLPYNMQAPVAGWVPLGTVNVAAGGRTARLNWTGLEGGKNYEWYAAVSDGNLTSSSSPRRFSTLENQPPSITLDSPTTGDVLSTPITINLRATATDTDGTIRRVEFYREGVKLGEDTTAPFAYEWDDATVGTHNISAVAVDNDNAATLSNIARITVQVGDEMPTVSLTAPANGTALPAPANLTLTANAQDAEGPVSRVEFFVGSTPQTSLGVDTQAPFTRSLTGLAPGSYIFTAKATDSRGQTVTSAPVMVSVFVEASVPNNAAQRSVGLFDPPAWTVVATSAAPHDFNLPGTNDGDLEVKVAGAAVPFNGGITLATNWNSPASIAGAVDALDNLALPFADTNGNVYVSVLDNSNDNTSSANPTTTEQTSGISVAYLPYSAGWTGASVDTPGTVLSGNLPAGVTVNAMAIPGTYSIDGLSTAGNLLAVPNGNGGSLGDNVCSVRVEDGRWVVDVRDNDSNGQNGTFSFVYVPPATPGVFAAAVSSTGAVTQASVELAALGLTATPGPDGLDLQFGDGTVINPATAALFIATDSSRAAAAEDNLVAWSTNGNKFRIFSQDLPQINGTHQAVDVRILAIPFATGGGENVVTITAPDATAGEGGADQTLGFEVTRSGSTAAPLTVTLAASGTAASGTDYSGFQNSLVIPAGQASSHLPLTVLSDNIAEGTETVQITVVEGSGYTAGTAADATASIADRPAQDWSFTNISDPAKRGPQDDADGDGLPNLLEYYMGTLPQDGLSKGSTTLTATRQSAAFGFHRALNRNDVSAEVEWSTDLIHWFRSGQSNGTLTLQIEITTASSPADDPQVMQGIATRAGGGLLPEDVFFRLQVSE